MWWRQVTRWAKQSYSFTGSRTLALLDGAIRRREGFRLVALDLRDGESQGAFGAVDQVRESDDWCFAHDHALSVARRHANRLAEGPFRR